MVANFQSSSFSLRPFGSSNLRLTTGQPRLANLLHLHVAKTCNSYRHFLSPAAFHALLELIAQALSAIGQRFTLQPKPGR